MSHLPNATNVTAVTALCLQLTQIRMKYHFLGFWLIRLKEIVFFANVSAASSINIFSTVILCPKHRIKFPLTQSSTPQRKDVLNVWRWQEQQLFSWEKEIKSKNIPFWKFRPNQQFCTQNRILSFGPQARYLKDYAQKYFQIATHTVPWPSL